MQEVPKIKPREVVRPSRQLYTGNVCIDFTSPIAEGTMVTIEGDNNTGKSTVALNASIRYAQMEPSAHIVYFTTVAADASKFRDKFSAAVGSIGS